MPYPLSEFDPLVVKRINDIIDETKCKLVVSSSWRFDENLQNIFDEVGFKHKLFDITPYGMGKCRGEEIKQWLDKHENIEKYAIVDDDNDMLKNQRKYFVRTNEFNGLTEELKIKILKILE